MGGRTKKSESTGQFGLFGRTQLHQVVVEGIGTTAEQTIEDGCAHDEAQVAGLEGRQCPLLGRWRVN